MTRVAETAAGGFFWLRQRQQRGSLARRHGGQGLNVRHDGGAVIEGQDLQRGGQVIEVGALHRALHLALPCRAFSPFLSAWGWFRR